MAAFQYLNPTIAQMLLCRRQLHLWKTGTVILGQDKKRGDVEILALVCS
jgi:hypothetical protein